ncbi:MAG: putative CRISPR-associated endoribonuclease-like protein Cas6nc [Candidatus Methanogaster sp.]|nr:MAG: putative CRISPR-associated endoribonuclease-like protein Cas6nc [ANME-2 cluster archaeon]
MRSKLTLRKTTPAPIHYDYQYGIAAMLYKKLAHANIRLANEIHSHTGFKFYTFSNLIFDDRIPARNGLNFEQAHFYLSSPDPEFIRSFTEGLLQAPEFHLRRTETGKERASILMERIEILPKETIGEVCKCKAISPIYVKTQRLQDGRLRDYDLYPTDGKFYENLHTNLVARYREYHGHDVSHDHFEITAIRNIKPKRIKIANTFRRCSLMEFEVQGSLELLEFAYEAGIGEKNAMGFGCLQYMG